MNNKSIYKCKNCRQEYCAECTENDDWKEFCSDECSEEYKKEAQS